MSKSVELERTYLQTALSWLDARLEQVVIYWRQAGRDPEDRYRGLYISDDQALNLVRQNETSEITTLTTDQKRLEKVKARALSDLEAIEDDAHSRGNNLRLRSIKHIFGLSEFEWWAFVICLAPSLDLRYERIYAYLQDDVTRISPSVDLILDLLVSESGLSRLEPVIDFAPNAILRTFHLILPVPETGKPVNILRQAFCVDQGVVNWLLNGTSSLIGSSEEDEYISVSSLSSIYETFQDVFSLPGLPQTGLIQNITPLLSLHGPDRNQQELAARQLAGSLERPLLKIQVIGESDYDAVLEQLTLAVRNARLLGAVLLLMNSDRFIDQDGCLIPSVFKRLNLLNDVVLLGSTRPFRFSPDMPGNDAPMISIPCDRISAAEREKLWKLLIQGVGDNITASDIQILSGQFNLVSGQVIAAASTAMSHALQSERGLETPDLFAAARLHSGHHLTDLAQKIEPRYVWEDLVLPETPITMLKEMVSMVQTRPLVLEGWGLGKKLTASSGVSALFSGPPGTGKTLAAQIMASQLGIDLYRIDLSTVVSKYVGETEKNLEHIFSGAAESNAILFFDEADSIFGKRSEVKDAHDRYANIEVGYLLQRMEDYSGIAILATNLLANLDEAFTRRLHFIINFPFPDEEYRLQIWEVLMPPDMPRAKDLDLTLMANRFKLAGGSIRNIIVSAAYLAAADGGRVSMSHLMHGTRREFQKMGRLIQEEDFMLPSTQGV